MASESARALLNLVWSILSPLGHPIALMGGLSLAAWNHIRATRDVDILIAIDAADIEPLVEQLCACGVKPRKWPPIVEVGDHRFMQFLHTPPDEFYEVRIDLMLAATPQQKSAITRRVRRDLPGFDQPIDVVSCEDLILFKLAADRMIDRADAAMLLRENRDQLDFTYLRHWVHAECLETLFAEIWEEAFPGETVPQGTDTN